MSIYEDLRKRRKSTLQMIKTITNTQTVERKNSHTDRRNQPGSFDPVGFTLCNVLQLTPERVRLELLIDGAPKEKACP